MLQGDWGQSSAPEPVTEASEPTVGSDEPARRRDAELVDRLLTGDQRAFLLLFREWHPSMVRVALNYVRRRSLAEEVAQEAWLHFMQQLESFRGQSSLKTWAFRILVNRAINRGKREQRAVSLIRDATAVSHTKKRPPPNLTRGSRRIADSAWAQGGKGETSPEESLLSAETRLHLEESIRALPEKQKLVLTLRDIQGWRSAEVCELLNISAENQRVILHRARVAVREAIGAYLGRR